MTRPSNKTRPAFTLLELVVVMAVLIVLAGLVVPLLSNVRNRAAISGTKLSLDGIRDAISGTTAQVGYVQNMGGDPLTMANLFVAPTGAGAYNPVLRRGWHGPYLQNATGTYLVNAGVGFTTDYGAAQDPAVVDAWNHPVVIQFPADSVTTDPGQKMLFARLVSAGPDGVIQTPETALYPTTAQRGDDLVLFLMRPDIAPATVSPATGQ